MLAVYKKELRSYLTSMVGYVFIAFVLLILGIYFTAYNLQFASSDFGGNVKLCYFFIFNYYSYINHENTGRGKKNRTDQLLLTAPVPVWKVVLGKYLSMVTIYAIPVVISAFYPLIMGKYGTVSYPMAYAAVLGFFLFGMCSDCSGTVSFFRYRKSGHCSSIDLWDFVLQLYDGWN